jgi:hypothetical protein
MHDDNKRTHDIKTWLTDREFIDICKQAEREDRKPSEMLRVMARRYMYGNIGPLSVEIHGSNSASEGS